MHLWETRPRLARGLRVVRRGPDHLQVGLYDGRRVLLPRSESVEHTLALLLEQGALDEEEASQAVLDRLDRHGCLASKRPSGPARARVAVLRTVEAPGLPDVRELLGAAGVTLTSSTFDAAVVLAVSAGELDRDRLDPLIRSQTSHLVVRLVDGGAVLGPFVVPGTTACLRCIDAHHSVGDPDHIAVTTRYVRATSRVRRDGVPDLEPALTALALAWAVRDVVAHLEGHEPSTWSRTVHLGEEPAKRTERNWLRHPQCGCCWPAELAP
jgi:bacteriocin biosynthesis cyclodehydratase domain-containing protein